MDRPQLYDWLVVGLCFLALSLSFSARSVPGLTMSFLEADLDRSPLPAPTRTGFKSVLTC